MERYRRKLQYSNGLLISMEVYRGALGCAIRSTVAIFHPGPRFRLLRRPPPCNGGHLPSGSVQRAPRSQVVVPGGRGPGPPGASSCEPPPQDATPRSAFRIVSRRRPSMSAADGPYTLASLRSQYINSLRSRKCSQPFAAAVEKWIVADHRRAVRGWAKVANTRSTSRSVLAAKAWSCGPRVWQPPADR